MKRAARTIGIVMLFTVLIVWFTSTWPAPFNIPYMIIRWLGS